MGGAQGWRVERVFGRAMQVVGAWPTPDSLAERILSELRTAADEADDEPTRSRLRTALAVLGQGAVDTGTNLLAAVIARSIGQA